MNVVMNDVIYADVIEFKRSLTPLSSGQTHSSIADNLRAIFQEMGLELIDYHQCIRIPITVDNNPHVTVRVSGRLWQERQ